MNQNEISNALTNRFLASSSVEMYSVPATLIGIATDFLLELARDLIPPKGVFLAALTEALNRFFDSVDSPGPDEFVEPKLILVILSAAELAYDYLAKEVG